ncbi:Protein nervous wreck [Lamellibrachia satsuma]|nr:Protein nervous wreck [Lamellibrachia satsuma]
MFFSLKKDSRTRGHESRPTSNDDRGGSPTGQPSRVPTDSTYINYEEDDYIDETFAPSGDSLEPSDNGYWSGRSYPTRCMSLYDFQASNADELNLKENEYLELVGDGDGDGWVRARNADGKVGYIPENYIQVVDDQSEVVDETEVIVDSDSESAANQQAKPQSPLATGTTGSGGSAYSATDYEVQETVMSPSVSREGPWAIAIYDYRATCEDELSFREGQRIRLMTKDENGVDDGFWQGEIDGKVGVFPSLVVIEEVNVDDHDLVKKICSPDRPDHPAFTPPEPGPFPPHLTVTEPSPSPKDERAAESNGRSSMLSVHFYRRKTNLCKSAENELTLVP